MSMPQPLYSVEILSVLAQVLEPAARAYQGKDGIEIHLGDKCLGHITLDSSDKWYVTSVQMYRDTRHDTWSNIEGTEGPFDTPAKAIRNLFACPDERSVIIEEDVSPSVQESTIQNATTQIVGDDIGFGLSVRLEIPEHVENLGYEATVEYLRDMLGRAASVVPGLGIRVQIGPSGA